MNESSKVMPYVYMCIHKTTNQFYIGSRASKSQKLPSHLDFPKYQTSSKYVKPIFEEFYWFIVAEFFNSIDAYDFEQELIKENFDNKLIINCHYYLNKKRFTRINTKHSDETKNKMSKSRIGKKHTEESKLLMSIKQKGKIKTEEARRNMSIAQTGKIRSEEYKLKKSIATSGEKNWNYGGTISDSHKKILSETRKGELNPMYGRSGVLSPTYGMIATEETRKKLSISHSQYHDFLCPNGKILIYITYKDLCEIYNLIYKSAYTFFKKNGKHRGFIKLHTYDKSK